MKLNRLLCAASFLILSAPLVAFAGESCSMFSGTCRDACGANEVAEAGAFDDCGEKQECCSVRAAEATRCCVLSFEQKDHGPGNCIAPVQGACAKGSTNTTPCEKLSLCR